MGDVPSFSDVSALLPIQQHPQKIVYAWVNDETTLRKAESTDPYSVFTDICRKEIRRQLDELFRELKLQVRAWIHRLNGNVRDLSKVAATFAGRNLRMTGRMPDHRSVRRLLDRRSWTQNT